MQWFHDVLTRGGFYSGGHLVWWKVVGWLANAVFASRFLVQWHATEKQKKVVVPVSFWWLSLSGTLLFLLYALFDARDPIFICAYALNWIPYIRNLMIHHRHEDALVDCANCGNVCLPATKYCPECGARLSPSKPATTGAAAA